MSGRHGDLTVAWITKLPLLTHRPLPDL